MGFAFGNFVKRRLGDINIAVLNKRAHIAEEERQKQRADMRAVDVGIRHNDDFVITKLGNVKIIADAGAERQNDRRQFIVADNFVDAGFFDVEHFAPKRQNRLNVAVAPLFGGAAGGIALDDINFGVFGVAVDAVRQFAGQGVALERGFSSGAVPRFPRGFSGARSVQSLVENRLGDGRVFFKIGHHFVIDHFGDKPGHFGVAEFPFCLPFKLGFGQFYADYGGQTLAAVLAGKLFVGIF